MAARGGNQSDLHKSLLGFVTGYITSRGGWCYKVWGGPFSRPGIPDCLACVGGRMVACEIKTGNAVLDPRQKEERRKLEASGALYVECRVSEDIEDALLAAGLIDAPSIMRYGGR